MPQASHPILHFRVVAGSAIGRETVRDVAAETERLEREFAGIRSDVSSKLHERARDMAEPVRVANGSLLINEDTMLPELRYEIEWNGEHYRVFKTSEGVVNIVEVVNG